MLEHHGVEAVEHAAAPVVARREEGYPSPVKKVVNAVRKVVSTPSAGRPPPPPRGSAAATAVLPWG